MSVHPQAVEREKCEDSLDYGRHLREECKHGLEGGGGGLHWKSVTGN